ncbi:LuxR family two component transcriptional regulator [Desulfitobacterium sp. LBE]|uniref:Oxygen regulatory protein NreC n=1 Tax=bioreactor metagenome TaxID=1076179 RepID=A0A644W1U8_9ZZZZ|nr:MULTISPECIES: response regulator transcription factor [Desulfitobacterium]MEA5024881.1 response regulator transcription factor [Desulfitobacterium hafniense]TWH59592.1 LuxR family two component transcriptional regulator [Desulfitobacterium sp. LBE]
MTRQIRLFLVDDHSVLRSGLKMILNSQKDMVVIGEAESGSDAIAKIKQINPDIVLLDISMPKMSGLEALEKLSKVSSAKILMLTMHADEKYLQEALKAGASGYVLKQAADTELLQAIRDIAQGEIYLDSNLAQNLVKSIYSPRKESNSSDSNLTEREKEVLRYIALGYTNKEIGESLLVSVKTVETHKARIMEKLQCHKRSDLVRYALEHGYIST